MDRAREPRSGRARARAGRERCHGRLILQVEDRALPDERVLLDLLPGGLRLLEHREHALAAGARGAQRAALDQRLDRLLVDRAVVDALAEVPQGRELPALLAAAFDRLNRLVADALDGVEAEADVADQPLSLA